MRHELLRKAVHTLLALGIAVTGIIAPVWVVHVLALALLFTFAVTRSWRRTRALYAVPRVSYGEFFFIAGIMVSAWLFLPDYLVAWEAGILVLAFADPLAGLIGRRFGTHPYRIRGELRSFEGSGACLLASTAVFLAVGAPVPVAVASGIILALVETSSLRGSDNFFLPVVAGALAMFAL